MRFRTANKLALVGVLRERCSLVELRECDLPLHLIKYKSHLGVAFVFGGDEEDRTPDLRIANATLSQLSYVPGYRGIPHEYCAALLY
jgi:hypothetical protein